ncbi:hypothetical protein Tsp_15221, partial [Trichinella spiralis]|uniref:hypothetical protein n=1 Tax=Trichinella spiralis TaxID=6334 RepID=UPI0001EFE2CE
MAILFKWHINSLLSLLSLQCTAFCIFGSCIIAGLEMGSVRQILYEGFMIRVLYVVTRSYCTWWTCGHHVERPIGSFLIFFIICKIFNRSPSGMLVMISKYLSTRMSGGAWLTYFRMKTDDYSYLLCESGSRI